MHVPAGGLHGFRNESGHPASLLILVVPGAPREAYVDELQAFLEEHDNIWLWARAAPYRFRDHHPAS